MSYKVERAKVIARRKFEARELILNLKSGPCEDCGQKFEPCQMDFWRESGVSISKKLQMSQTRIIAEASTCKLLCACCSRLRTWKQARDVRSETT